MKCVNVEEQIPSLVAGTLPDVKALELHRHISRCLGCQAWYEEATCLFDTWHASPDPTLDIDLVWSVMQRLPVRISPLQCRPLPERDEVTPSPEMAPTPRATLVNHADADRKRQLLLRMSLYNYGVAASIAVVLLYFGIFNQVGPLTDAFHGLMFGKLQGWLAYASINL